MSDTNQTLTERVEQICADANATVDRLTDAALAAEGEAEARLFLEAERTEQDAIWAALKLLAEALDSR